MTGDRVVSSHGPELTDLPHGATPAVHHQCAAAGCGCRSVLAYEDPDIRPGMATPSSHGMGVLRAHGWRQDHGRWICGDHPI